MICEFVGFWKSERERRRAQRAREDARDAELAYIAQMEAAQLAVHHSWLTPAERFAKLES